MVLDLLNQTKIDSAPLKKRKSFSVDLLSIRVQALAFLAEFCLHFASFLTVFLDGFDAAITAIVLATSVVVLVVTVAIAFEFVFPTAFHGSGIQTLALSAVGRFHFASFHTLVVRDGCSTAITTVPLATFVIVLVVTVAIAFEIQFKTA